MISTNLGCIWEMSDESYLTVTASRPLTVRLYFSPLMCSLRAMAPEEKKLMSPAEEVIDWAVSFIEKFENPDEPLFVWHPQKTLDDGAMTFPCCELSPDVMDFHEGLYKKGLIIPFDWGDWKAGKNYLDNPELLAKAPLIDCLKLLTCHVRADRFNEGHLASVLENGHITDILRRMREIREAGEPIDI